MTIKIPAHEGTRWHHAQFRVASVLQGCVRELCRIATAAEIRRHFSMNQLDPAACLRVLEQRNRAIRNDLESSGDDIPNDGQCGRLHSGTFLILDAGNATSLTAHKIPAHPSG